MKRRIFVFGTILLVWLSLEGASAFLLSLKNKKWQSPQQLFSQDFIIDKPGGCRWADQVTLHPYLGFMYKNNSSCPSAGNINSYHLLGAEIPFKKDPFVYTILVLGGSVAESLAGHRFIESSTALEEAFASQYKSAKGLPIRIINGSITAGSQPMQLISYILLAHLADAVVSIEGFNEHWSYGASMMIESPPRIWFQLSGESKDDSTEILKAAALKKLMRLYKHSPLRYSYVAYSSLLAFYTLLGGNEPLHDVNSPFPPLPTTWTPADQRAYYVGQYKKYLRILSQIALANNSNMFIFYQPVPAIEKALTPQEKQLVGNVGYANDYGEVFDHIRPLTNPFFHIINMMGVFRNFPETIYIDQIHFNDKGKFIASQFIAHTVAKSLGLKLISQPPLKTE